MIIMQAKYKVNTKSTILLLAAKDFLIAKFSFQLRGTQYLLTLKCFTIMNASIQLWGFRARMTLDWLHNVSVLFFEKRSKTTVCDIARTMV